MMARGFVYLAAVVDWFSRKVQAWRLSITMDTAFCIEAVEEALADDQIRGGLPSGLRQRAGGKGFDRPRHRPLLQRPPTPFEP
jgi:transposase InsO family protein